MSLKPPNPLDVSNLSQLRKIPKESLKALILSDQKDDTKRCDDVIHPNQQKGS